MRPPPPTPPPASPTAIGEAKYGCAYRGPHRAEPTTPEALVAAVDNADVTCIKLEPKVYAMSSKLRIGLDGDRPLAIVADEGQATLDGGGRVGLLGLGDGADVALANLRLQNGRYFDGGAICMLNGTMAALAPRPQPHASQP